MILCNMRFKWIVTNYSDDPEGIEWLKQNQKEIEGFLCQYLERNKENLDEFMKRTHEQYRTYIIGQRASAKSNKSSHSKEQWYPLASH